MVQEQQDLVTAEDQEAELRMAMERGQVERVYGRTTEFEGQVAALAQWVAHSPEYQPALPPAGDTPAVDTPAAVLPALGLGSSRQARPRPAGLAAAESDARPLPRRLGGHAEDA